MKVLLKNIVLNRWAAFTHDMLWIPVVLYLSYWLRFNLDPIPDIYFDSLKKLIAISLPVQGVLFWSFGLYRGIWRFASIPDLIRIVKSIVLGTLIILLLAVFLFNMINIPRSVFLLYPIFLVAGLIAPRILYRTYKDQRFQLQNVGGKRTLIVGAGQTAELLLRDLLQRKEYLPVGLVDDDIQKQKREIHGIRVYGSLGDIKDIIRMLDIEMVLFAIPSAGRDVVERVVEDCNSEGIECRTLPSWTAIGGEIGAGLLRPITVEDLLRREPVRLDIQAIAGYLSTKCVLVTGAGGSIGSELCRQIAHQKPSILILFEHGEYNLYSIDYELRTIHPELSIVPVLGDVKNERRVDWVFRKYKPDVIFHAAAYKHVPMLENNPAEGVANNILGTKMVADAADRYLADRFVLVSTDKAVNPANVMGTTKRISELYCQNLANKSVTKFITTRFGNVLGSAGSVVPLFEKQIRDGGPLTITHPEIKRYFMTIPEAVSLILQAGSMGQGGEIFVLDMGDPVFIKDLAVQMVKLSGLEPEKDIQFVYTGLRPGEKLFEEVFHEHESLRKTSHPKLLLANSRQVEWGWLTNEISCLFDCARDRDVPQLKKHLQNIVPEYMEGGSGPVPVDKTNQ